MMKRLFFLLCLVIASSAAAETRYQIEVIVFTQPPLADVAPEYPVHSPPSFPASIAWPLRMPGTRGVGPEALAATAHRLSGAANRLRGQPGFTVVWHEAWQQTLRRSGSAPAISLPAALRELGIEGRLRPYRGRFLHFEVDLRLATAVALEGQPPSVWRLAESRRMRSGEIHYLDHPRLGIIVRIDPLPGP